MRCLIMIALTTMCSTNAFLMHTPVLRNGILRSSSSRSAKKDDDVPENKSAKEKSPDAKKNVDIMSSPAFLKRKMEVLVNDMAEMETKIEESNTQLVENTEEWGGKLDQLQREYLNVQARNLNATATLDSKSTADIVVKVLSVIDNYDRAFGSVTPSTDEEKEIESAYKETYAKILETFEKLGVKEVETVGAEFDYEIHNAVMQKPSEDYEEGFVCEELTKGYVLDETLIRAAMVVVAF